jgi:hypothetical protein
LGPPASRHPRAPAAHVPFMTTSQTRVSRGIPTGGQFAADVRSEPTVALDGPATDPQVLANLNRAIRTIPEITEVQKERLRTHKTPLLEAFRRRGIARFAPAAKIAPRD